MSTAYRTIPVVALLSLIMVASSALAADVWEYFSVQSALESPLAKERLDPSIAIYMKGQKRPSASGETGDFTANKRARKLGKSAEGACQNAFISALLAFQQRADKEGRNTVIDLYSITKDKRFESTSQYSCLVGGMMANVALRGKVANIGE